VFGSFPASPSVEVANISSSPAASGTWKIDLRGTGRVAQRLHFDAAERADDRRRGGHGHCDRDRAWIPFPSPPRFALRPPSPLGPDAPGDPAGPVNAPSRRCSTRSA
jgi:hypothetical protein